MFDVVACDGLRPRLGFGQHSRLFLFGGVLLGLFFRRLLFRHGICLGCGVGEEVTWRVIHDVVMLHQRNGWEIPIIRLVGSNWRERLTFGALHEIHTIGDVARVEQCGRLSGTQIENVVDRHIGGVGLLRRLIGHCIGEQIRYRS